MNEKLFALDEENIYEHLFERYSQLNGNIEGIKQDLGIHDKTQNVIEVDIQDTKVEKKKRKKKVRSEIYNFVIEQSLSSLGSSNDNNKNSTTGYVLWSTTLIFLNWLLYGESDVCKLIRNGEAIQGNEVLKFDGLFQKNDSGKKGIIELGSGISGILSIVMSNHVDYYVATDQNSILNKLKFNIRQNILQLNMKKCKSKSLNFNTKEEEEDEQRGVDLQDSRQRKQIVQLETLPLDWETFQLLKNNQPLVNSNSKYPILYQLKEDCSSIVILAMDVIYNDYLIKPFLDTVKELFQFYQLKSKIQISCIVGLQLRAQDMIEMFLETIICEYQFVVHHVSDSMLAQTRCGVYLLSPQTK
ncbi:hypothetical protein TBLA_0H01190 [Henningerozyma blattae CBS 6284]|uniref:Ribosomal lysine N-methyltransferase 5 n=1 Tax=Henningerozyma blattae (strain ATCC 34711 / CBS 6284 / DSM 70876 / NBRC 10599 / NRRL Y-10934 / UCD 77-7) TaxID=1071380 RepID=I2H7Q5_HENB6|nr:hypothetical protein TBLA_0H01190 [Tetrapisispora blattae CBS 6284]CCH62407.1 hypothetical protein TBLA_0H01190 [Tetrapisispora blattae CBS 6284]